MFNIFERGGIYFGHWRGLGKNVVAAVRILRPMLPDGRVPEASFGKAYPYQERNIACWAAFSGIYIGEYFIFSQ